MKVDQFIAEVRNLADLASTEEAEKATRATLEVLRERIAAKSLPTSPPSFRRR